MSQSARENLEHNFRWTRRNFALIGIFGIALPIIVYKGIVKDFDKPLMQEEATEHLNYSQKLQRLVIMAHG